MTTTEEVITPTTGQPLPVDVPFEGIINNLAQQIAQLTVDLAVARAQIAVLQGQ